MVEANETLDLNSVRNSEQRIAEEELKGDDSYRVQPSIEAEVGRLTPYRSKQASPKVMKPQQPKRVVG